MKVLIAGLSPQSSIAAGMIVRSVFGGAGITERLRGSDCTPPALAADAASCDLCVIDLMGLGWSAPTPQRETQLDDRLLGDRPAIVLMPPGDGGGWSAAPSLKRGNAPRIALRQPASMATLQAALLSLRDKVRRGTAEPRPGPAPKVSAAGSRLAMPDFAALALACPALAAQPFLKLVVELAQRDEPSELRIGRQTGVVLCPQENWASASLPAAIRKRLAQHPAMVQIVEVRSLSAGQAAVQARLLYGRRSDGRRSLDAFIWSLAWHSFEAMPLAVAPALRLRLERFPNFTRLPPGPELHIQLAWLLMRQARSVAELQRAFPQHDPRRIDLFVVCALLSGMAQVVPPEQALADAAAAAPRTPPPKRGFIKSLLAKLF